jgi:hypothetical protein
MLPDSDYLTFDLAPLDEPGSWPRPMLSVVELGSGGRVEPRWRSFMRYRCGTSTIDR